MSEIPVLEADDDPLSPTLQLISDNDDDNQNKSVNNSLLSLKSECPDIKADVAWQSISFIESQWAFISLAGDAQTQFCIRYIEETINKFGNADFNPLQQDNHYQFLKNKDIADIYIILGSFDSAAKYIAYSSLCMHKKFVQKDWNNIEEIESGNLTRIKQAYDQLRDKEEQDEDDDDDLYPWTHKADWLKFYERLKTLKHPHKRILYICIFCYIHFNRYIYIYIYSITRYK